MKKLYASLAVTSLLVMICATGAAAALYGDWDDEEQFVYGLVNLQRNINGLPDLIADSRLHTAADLHSKDMAKNDYFSHTSQDGTKFYQRVKAQGYDYKSTGENIAWGYRDAYAVMYGTNDLALLSDFDIQLGNNGFSDWDEVGQGWSGADWDAWDIKRKDSGGWMGSKGHRENILEGAFTDIGVGYYYLDPDPGKIRGRHYWTQDFASGDTAPVPLPPSVLLLGSGILWGLGFLRIKK